MLLHHLLGKNETKSPSSELQVMRLEGVRKLQLDSGRLKVLLSVNQYKITGDIDRSRIARCWNYYLGLQCL